LNQPEKAEIKTTYDQTNSDLKKSDNEFKLHEESAKFISNWWKENGKTINVKNLMKL
jgi:hypothetical protein